jgi:predicted acylesterase/phospholipase RssA
MSLMRSHSDEPFQIQAHPPFDDLPKEVLDKISAAAEEYILPAGSTLVKQGDLLKDVYLLTRGRLRVTQSLDGSKPSVLGEVTPGELIGEIAILTNRPRSATVQALRECSVVRLPGTIFQEIEARYPAAMFSIMRNSMERALYGTDNPHPIRKKCFSAIVLGKSPPATSLTIRLAEQLNKIGKTLHVNKTLGDSWVESRNLEQFERRLDVEERKHNFSLYETHAGSKVWNKQCNDRADTLLLIVDPTTSPEEYSSDNHSDVTAAGRLKPGIELVFAHPAELVSTVAKEWVDKLQPGRCHHVRNNHEGDISRLARIVAEQAQGIVFSGGGVRGFVHLGVIKALREARIPLDMVGGTSIGSLAAACIALEWSDEQIWDSLRLRQVAHNSVFDFTLPIVSLTRGKRLTDLINQGLPNINIEELSRPYFCISSNLTRGEIKVHSSGPLRKAVRASVSIPVLFPPQVENGEVLVDGGIINNLPIDVIKDWVSDSGRVIAVDISLDQEVFPNDLDEGGVFSGWKYLSHRLNPLRGNLTVPTVAHQLIRLTEIANKCHRHQGFKNADFLIQPPSNDFKGFNLSTFEKLFDFGYEHTLRELDNGLPAGILSI